MVGSSSSHSSPCCSLFNAASLAQGKCVNSGIAVEELDGMDRKKVQWDFWGLQMCWRGCSEEGNECVAGAGVERLKNEMPKDSGSPSRERKFIAMTGSNAGWALHKQPKNSLDPGRAIKP